MQGGIFPGIAVRKRRADVYGAGGGIGTDAFEDFGEIMLTATEVEPGGIEVAGIGLHRRVRQRSHRRIWLLRIADPRHQLPLLLVNDQVLQGDTLQIDALLGEAIVEPAGRVEAVNLVQPQRLTLGQSLLRPVDQQGIVGEFVRLDLAGRERRQLGLDRGVLTQRGALHLGARRCTAAPWTAPA